ncbi:MAG TPA: succinate dehydrogenase/fumarate reductase flavoprotein subunit, partial [Rhabdaerophilum sp.]|nr:succinate dehydrogenase/fumarate reductase flavoprotein subunit [Rhabdaerophilum sp.]
PDEDVIGAAIERVERPFTSAAGDLNRLREGLLDLMWDKVGVIRDGKGLAEGRDGLAKLRMALDGEGVADGQRGFNLTWHDWLNLDSLIEVSEAITAAATARTDSRGSHFRDDHPVSGALETSAFTVVRKSRDGAIETSMEPVRFTIVKPGETILKEPQAAE